MSFLELEAQVQSLLDATRVAIDSVNARGNTVAARLQNIPARVTEVTEYGAHEGAARAIVVISTMSRGRGAMPSRSLLRTSTTLLMSSPVTSARRGSLATSLGKSQTRL